MSLRAWAPAHRLMRRVIGRAERFLAIEAAGGMVLLLTAALALVWANSPWRASYQTLWRTPVALGVNGWVFRKDLRFLINDGWMTLFFFVVGLEIRRELHSGALSELKRAMLPVAAALGGMLVPACGYWLLNHGRPSSSGWGVPMATDIAFAVGVLTLLGKRVPSGLRVLLLALAVIDDVGAIIVIALFYSAGLVPSGLATLALGVALTLAFQALGVRSAWIYVLPAGVLWMGAYQAGVHPTLAGVILGLLTPAGAPGLDRIEQHLHPWVAFAIMPLFALANAGFSLGHIVWGQDSERIFIGIAAGLAIGKPVGILLLCWLAASLRVSSRPGGISWSELSPVGLAGGIGFTMALFIAQLAFPDGPNLDIAKLAILCGSATAAVLALTAGRLVLSAPSGVTAGSSTARRS